MGQNKSNTLRLFIGLFLGLIMYDLFNKVVDYYIWANFELAFPDTYNLMYLGLMCLVLAILSLVYMGIIDVKLPRQIKLD